MTLERKDSVGQMEAPILGSNGMLSMHRFNDEPKRVRIEACSDLPLAITDRLIEGLEFKHFASLGVRS